MCRQVSPFLSATDTLARLSNRRETGKRFVNKLQLKTMRKK